MMGATCDGAYHELGDCRKLKSHEESVCKDDTHYVSKKNTLFLLQRVCLYVDKEPYWQRASVTMSRPS